MKKVFIKDLKEKEKVRAEFIVTKKEVAVSKVGKPYLNLKLMDKSGECEGRAWDRAEDIAAQFSKDDVVLVSGHCVEYQGRIQINVSSVKTLQEDAYDISDFLPSAVRPFDEMMTELDAVVASVKDKDISALLVSIINDKEIREKYKKAPAAKGMHHPYLGGLLEHVLSLCKLGDFVCTHYDGVNKDLVTAGLILHDIGKIIELSFDRSIEYTDEGRLLGHITIGVELIESKIRELPDFPRELAVLLKHIILSHHGILEYGSPKRPKTVEAFIVSFLDDMDAKVNSVQAAIDDEAGIENWTPFQRLLSRYIYKGTTSSSSGYRARADENAESVKKDRDEKEVVTQLPFFKDKPK